jgi:hypothetical protein
MPVVDDESVVVSRIRYEGASPTVRPDKLTKSRSVLNVLTVLAKTHARSEGWSMTPFSLVVMVITRMT